MISRAIEYLNPGAQPLRDFVLVDDGELRIDDWRLPGEPPTIAELQTVAESPEFAAWLEERGGDPAKTLKRRIRDRVAAAIDDRDEGTLLTLALIDVLADRFNISRSTVRNAVISRVEQIIDGTT